MSKRVLLFSILFLNLVHVQAQSDCDRSCLTGIIDNYFEGLTANTTRGIPLASEARITENGKVRSLPDTFWEDALQVSYRWDIVNK